MRIFLAAAALTGLLLSACVGDMASAEKGDATAPRKVLFAGLESEYKARVVEAAVKALGTDGFYFRVAGLEALSTEDLSKYGAIVIVSPVMAGRINKRAAAFIGAHPDDARVIAFVTRGSDDTPMQEKEREALPADAVTGASVMEKVDERAAALAALIRKRF